MYDSTFMTLDMIYQAALEAGITPTTRRAYRRDVRYLSSWTKHTHKKTESYPVSIDLVVKFILEHTGHMNPKVGKKLLNIGLRAKAGPLRVRTLRRYLASLSVAHSEHGAATPTQNPQIKLLLRRL